MKQRSSLLIVFFNLLSVVLADLRVGFYQSTCPHAEDIVRGIVKQTFSGDKTIPAALLRMHFHDCFVHGCDASVLIDSTSQNQAEKESVPNQTVRGWELIDQIKEALEAACPNNVSCADIITLATRDSVALAGGPHYAVPTGRRDGLVSRVGDVNLPGPSTSIPNATKIFEDKGLTLADMVTLLGGHTVGVSHCSFFKSRLTTDAASMDSVLATSLTDTCNSVSSNPTVFLDQNTSFVVDNEFYKQILLRKGILKIDQAIADDASTAGIVSGFAKNGTSFMQNFANAMVKMGSIQVLVGNAGEVRTNCRVFNSENNVSPPPPPPPPPPPKKGGGNGNGKRPKNPKRSFKTRRGREF